jgi:NADH-quinone oxidoreductase subunit G
MQKIELTIEGQRVRARPGATILEAAAEVGVDVPRLCRLKGRERRAVCRLCAVGIEGRPGLVSACSTPARAGMVVDVFGERPNARRRVIMELVLAEHGQHGGGMCEVESLAQELGVSSSRFAPRPRAPNPGGSEYVVVESEACIRCDRCMQACERGVISRLGRGGEVYLAFDGGRSVEALSCVGCGDCVVVCPAGGLRLARSV